MLCANQLLTDTTYLSERRKLMQDWADFIDTCG